MAVARNASPHTCGSLLSSSSIALTPKNMLTYPTTPANVCSQLLTLPKNWNGIMSMIAATRIIGRYTASYSHAAESVCANVTFLSFCTAFNTTRMTAARMSTLTASPTIPEKIPSKKLAG